MTAVPTNGSVARISLSLRLASEVRAALREIEPDIVHLHEPFMPLLPFATLRHSAALNIATFHAYSGSRLGYRIFAPMLGHYANQILRSHRRLGARSRFCREPHSGRL